jgi:glycosyltransferase involved in cell wall biosynthesis
VETLLLSVVIPIWNGEKHLPMLFTVLENQSVLNVENAEVILVDDGSTDNSAEKIKLLQQRYSNVRYIYQENAGQCVARNTGIEAARGEYLYMMDQDDVVVPNTLIPMTKVAKERDAEIIVFEYDILEPSEIDQKLNGETQREPHIVAETDGIGYFQISGAFCPRAQIWTNIYKREFLNHNRLRFVEYKVIFEDLIFNYDTVFVAKKVIMVDNLGYYWVQYPTSDSHQNSNIARVGEKRFNALYLCLYIVEAVNKLKDLVGKNHVCQLRKMLYIADYYHFFGWTYMLQYRLVDYQTAVEMYNKCVASGLIGRSRRWPDVYDDVSFKFKALYWLLSWKPILKLALRLRLKNRK